MVFKDERGLMVDFGVKYSYEYFIVQFDSVEDMSKAVPVTLIATSKDEDELLDYQSEHENGDMMCVMAGDGFYKNFLGGAQLC